MPALITSYEASAGSAVFQQLIRDAIASHPTVRSAFARRGQAQAERDAARAALRPQLDVEVQGRASLASDFGDDFDNLVDRSQSDDDARAALVARQLLFDGGAASGRLEAAGLTAEEAAASAESEVSEFALSAITAYYDVARYRMMRDLLLANVARHETLLADIEDRLSQGVAGARDEARGKARLADARAQLVGVERLLEEARSRYVAVFDDSPSATALPALPFTEVPPRLEVEERALAESPLLAAAALRRDASEAAYRSARAERFMPSISAELRGTRYNIGEPGEDYDVSAILAVNYSLYSGGLKSARQNRAFQELRQAQFDADAARREVLQRARTAHQALASLDNELVLLGEAAQANADSRDIFAEQFAVAGGSVLDVYQAEEDYVFAARNYINGLVDRGLAAYALYAETGQLLPSFDFYLMEDGPGTSQQN